jgi:hypothetical protein
MSKSSVKRPAPRAGRGWTIPKGDLLTIACNREVIAAYPVKTDYPAVFPRDR